MKLLVLVTSCIAIAFGVFLGYAVSAHADVNGISDDNLPMMTQRGLAAIEKMPFAHARMVISMGTPAHDPQVFAWMMEASRHPWTVMVSARRVTGQPMPTARAYTAWLRGLLKVYPQISAVEATNEPEMVHMSPAQAAKLYRAAKKAARGRRVKILAGGFSDGFAHRKSFKRYVREYARLVPASTYALHAYIGAMRGNLKAVKWTILATHAKHIWITETAAFVAHGEDEYNNAEQLQQTRRVVAMSNWPKVQRTYWQGWESCNGCQPEVTSNASAPTAAAANGPVVPYAQAYSPIVWDSYLLASTSKGTAYRPGLSLVGG